MLHWHEWDQLLRSHYAGNSVRKWLVVAGLILAGMVAALLVRVLLTRVVARLTAKTDTRLDDRLVGETSGPLAMLTFLGFTQLALHVPRLPAKLHDMVVDANAVAMAMVTALVVWRVLDVLFDELMTPWAQRHEPPINPQVVSVTRAVAKWSAVAVLAVTALHRAGFDIISVVTGLGIGGVAVAFAAQETLANVLGALQIMTDQPFVVGDIVKIDNDHSGRVLRTGLRSTRLRTTSGVVVVVPNKKIAAAVLQNFSHVHGLVRDVTLQLDRDLSAERLQQATDIVSDILRNELRVSPQFSVALSGFGDWSSQIRIIYYIPNPDEATQVVHELLLAVRARLDAAGIRFAVPPVGLPGK